MADHKFLRASATLSFLGVLLSLVAGYFHPDRQPANNHVATFGEYAQSTSWTAVHFGQFLGMALIIAGLLVLFFALDIRSEKQRLAARFGAVTATVALALYGVLQGVDGVALKQAVDAWMRAPDAEKAARFASAEVIRWMEWGIRSYQSFVLGLAFILFGAAIVWSARIPRPIGYLMSLSGLAYIAQGWVIGSEGFSPNNSIPTLVGILTVLLWSIWFLVSAWRGKGPVQATPQPTVEQAEATSG